MKKIFLFTTILAALLLTGCAKKTNKSSIAVFVPGIIDDSPTYNMLVQGIKAAVEEKNQTTVYEIQDIVEKKLMGSSRKEVAQSYITYRYNRDVARKSKTKEVFLDIIGAKANIFRVKYLHLNFSSSAIIS